MARQQAGYGFKFYLPGFRWLLKDFTLHLLKNVVDVLEIGDGKFLDGSYTQTKQSR